MVFFFGRLVAFFCFVRILFTLYSNANRTIKLLFQVMALQTPFEGHSVTVHRNEVILGSKRPPLEGSVWTQNLSRMTTCCWSAEIQARPEFADILSVIREEASRLEEENMGDSESTVFDRSRHTERSL